MNGQELPNDTFVQSKPHMGIFLNENLLISACQYLQNALYWRAILDQKPQATDISMRLCYPSSSFHGH